MCRPFALMLAAAILHAAASAQAPSQIAVVDVGVLVEHGRGLVVGQDGGTVVGPVLDAQTGPRRDGAGQVVSGRVSSDEQLDAAGHVDLLVGGST